jgi:hypothetical protein
MFRNRAETCRSYELYFINPLNAKLNPICHLLTLLGAHPILYVSIHLLVDILIGRICTVRIIQNSRMGELKV